MFMIGDRVRKRFRIGDSGEWSPEGTVVAVHGRWLHVKHDSGKGKGSGRIPPRFDYKADELEHLNPLLRLAEEL
jgi:hypothetical protein